MASAAIAPRSRQAARNALPTVPLLHNNRGLAYAELGEYRRAIEDYDEALRLNPGYALAHKNRKIALGHLGE